jgi:HemK-related putative methylase
MYSRYRLFQKKKHDHPVLEKIDGAQLIVLPSVLNPKSMRTGAFFASQLNSSIIAHDAEVLDMGTGSGVCAIIAAKFARCTVAVDINPAAVRCTKINALLHNVESKIEVLQGDLFAPVVGRCFDVVLFNPPFLRGAPKDDADCAWRSIDVAERFAAEVKNYLKPSGFALVLLSTFGDAAAFIEQFHRCGLRIALLSEREFFNEKLSILKLT